MKKLFLTLSAFAIMFSASAQDYSAAIVEVAKLLNTSVGAIEKIAKNHKYEISSVNGMRSFTIYVTNWGQTQTWSDILCSQGYPNLRVKQLGSIEWTDAINRQNQKLRDNGCGR